MIWPFTGAMAGFIATAGTVLIALGTALSFRKMYAWSLGEGRRGVEALLSAVAVRAQGGWGLGLAPGENETSQT